jgi:hypothetical protein
MSAVAPDRMTTAMRTNGTVFVTLMLLSCANQPVITAQDYKTGVYTVCGGHQASKDELNTRAFKACPAATPKVLRCTADVKYPTVGIEGEVTASGNCCDYECPRASAP